MPDFPENPEILSQFAELLAKHKDIDHPEVRDFFENTSQRNPGLFAVMSAIREMVKPTQSQ